MIVVECYRDELLIRCMDVPKKLIKHAGGKGKVLEALKEKPQKAIGMIDKDPGANQPREIKKYTRIEMEWSVTIALMKKGNKKIIEIPPDLETCLLAKAKENKISPQKFEIPDDPKEFHKIPHIEKKDNVRKFMLELIRIDSEMKKLKIWLNEELQ